MAYKKGDYAAQALLRRIHQSDNVLEVHFPPVRPVTAATGPAARPLSPLTGPRPTRSLTAAEPAPETESKGIRCLWLDAPLSERMQGGTTRPNSGWIDGADALARVAYTDAMVDLEALDKGSWFDKALYVLFRGIRWRVVKVEPMGAGFRQPHSLSVWLAGANKQ